jgi:hypothetical protein
LKLSVSVTIQTHPARAGLADELRSRLGGRVGITVDPDPEARPSPWRCYREALDSTPASASHRLIVQDDIDPCPHFLVAARAAVRAQPDDLLLFYVGGNASQHASSMYRAAALGHQWARLSHQQFVPVVAACWPARLVCPAVCWVSEQPWPTEFIADDEIIGHFCRAHDVFPLATVPSLVEHRNELPSLMQTRHLDDPGRRAACLIGPGCDARKIDWTLGPA